MALLGDGEIAAAGAEARFWRLSREGGGINRFFSNGLACIRAAGRCGGRLPQAFDRRGIHIGVVLIFAAHAPAEAVVERAHSGVNRPSGSVQWAAGGAG